MRQSVRISNYMLILRAYLCRRCVWTSSEGLPLSSLCPHQFQGPTSVAVVSAPVLTATQPPTQPVLQPHPQDEAVTTS
jgi:hypothetical protein